jgi:hypothetical protein
MVAEKEWAWRKRSSLEIMEVGGRRTGIRASRPLDVDIVGDAINSHQGTQFLSVTGMPGHARKDQTEGRVRIGEPGSPAYYPLIRR